MEFRGKVNCHRKFGAFFLSGPLGDALKAAKVSRWFGLKKCRIVKGADQ